MAAITVLTDAFLIDCTGKEPVDGAAVSTRRAARCWGMTPPLADGPAEVRKAAREQLRHDVDQIKIMASGGAMSPSDELDTTQYTVEEMRAAVEEARAVGKYVLAHAYSAAAARAPLQAGRRSTGAGTPA